jgi:hypothetical protein
MCVALIAPAFATPGDDDDDASADKALVLTRAQVSAVGIVVAQPVAASPVQRIAAFGRVLDSAALIGDFAELDAMRTTERTATSEVERLRGLHAGGAAASLKTVQAALAEQSRARAQADTATARLGSRWGRLATMAPIDRQQLLQRLRSGNLALLRAEVPGRQSLSGVPQRAQITIDGIAHAARVTGVLRESGGESTNPALLIELPAAPPGLSSGARLAVTIEGDPVAGFIIPRAALLHDEQGAHVYQGLAAPANADTSHYARRNIELLMPVGESWLVRGVDADDRIVVRGVGLLWSMQDSATVDDD